MLTGPSAGDAEQAITNPSHERLTDRNARIDPVGACLRVVPAV